jgi:hypothetical protein
MLGTFCVYEAVPHMCILKWFKRFGEGCEDVEFSSSGKK